MHLVAPLASGVRGAENGTANIYLRGTSTAATWYADFEGSNGNSTGEIDLDEYGGAEVYVDGFVEVVVSDADGNQVRSFVSAANDAALEVQSTGFTGTDYTTGASAAGEPAILRSILDLWLTNSEAIDWKVKVGAVTNTIPFFLEQVIGMVKNVKDPQYGALGDGTTDDTSAINAALSGGGIVIVPPGTYRITSALAVAAGTRIIGSGKAKSIISMDHASNNSVNITASTGYVSIDGISITNAAACSGSIIVLTSGNVSIRDCLLGNQNTNGTTVSCTTGSLHMEGSSTDGTAEQVDASDTTTVSFERCQFSTPNAGFTGNVVEASEVRMDGCDFFNNVATGTYTNLLINPGGDCYITNCNFPDSNGATVTAIESAGSMGSGEIIYENGNIFGQAVTRYAFGSGDTDNWILGSRADYGAVLADTSGTVSINANQLGKVDLVHATATADAKTINFGTTVPLHARFTLAVWKDGANTLTITWGTGIKADTPTVVAANEVVVYEFVAMAGPSGTISWYQVGTGVSVAE